MKAAMTIVSVTTQSRTQMNDDPNRHPDKTGKPWGTMESAVQYAEKLAQERRDMDKAKKAAPASSESTTATKPEID